MALSAPSEKPKIELRSYQARAVIKWKNNNKKGIIALATGTGKTRLAIFIIDKYIENNVALIAVPSKELQKQWHEELVELLPSNITDTIIKIGGNSNIVGPGSRYLTENRRGAKIPIKPTEVQQP